jgi:hypothetical protein
LLGVEIGITAVEPRISINDLELVEVDYLDHVGFGESPENRVETSSNFHYVFSNILKNWPLMAPAEQRIISFFKFTRLNDFIIMNH